MSNQVIVVTSPDDVQNDGVRLLLIDLTPDQTQLISDALTQMENIPTVVTYVWNSVDSVDWMIGKKHKSDIIFFNADSENDIIVGYIAAQLNSYYFGTLKLLGKVNNSAIYTTDQLINILEKIIEQNGRSR
jgi:hypothetical protein